MPRRAPDPDLHEALAEAIRNTADESGADTALDATSALLATRGLKNWSVEDVARHSGVARATLYRRYGSRDVLIQQAVTREARRFFAAIAAAVTRTDESLTDTVANGMRHGLRLARTSPLGELVRRDPATAMAIISSSSLLDAATEALADLYLAMTTEAPGLRERKLAEARAEALVRLAISLLLIPGSVGADHDDDGSSRLRDMIAPLIEGGRFQPAERLLQNC